MDWSLAYVSDPARAELGWPAWAFVAVVAGLGTLAAFRSRNALTGDTLPAPRLRLYLTSFLWIAVLTWLACVSAGRSHIWLFWPPAITLEDAAIGIIALVLGLVAVIPIRRLLEPGRKRVRLLAPRTPAEFAGFIGLSAMAGFGEEVIYRGMLFMVFAVLIGNWWAAAVLSSVIFALAHMTYGWRHAVIIFLYGIRDCVVVGLTGALYVAMAVHFLHDVIVGVREGRRALKAEADAAA